MNFNFALAPITYTFIPVDGSIVDVPAVTLLWHHILFIPYLPAPKFIDKDNELTPVKPAPSDPFSYKKGGNNIFSVNVKVAIQDVLPLPEIAIGNEFLEF